MHLFLSPHLDDAILSCGGLIHQLVKQGKPVVIRTYMTGDPPTPWLDTPVVRDLHKRWEAGENPFGVRREEDRQAAQRLGAQVEHVGWLDCPYRVDATGKPLYTRNDDMFLQIQPGDPLLGETLAIPSGIEQVYSPLGAGNHVDHQIVALLARKLLGEVALCFYEEYPYGASGGEAARMTYHSGAQKYGETAVKIALAAFESPPQPRLIFLDEQDLSAKIAAIGCYESQISSFWDDKADMAARVRRYAQEVKPDLPAGAERLWVY